MRRAFGAPVDGARLSAVAELVSALIISAPTAARSTLPSFAAEVCRTSRRVYPVSCSASSRWRVARSAVGGASACAIGRDGDSLDLPEYHPLGLVRVLALPPGGADQRGDKRSSAAQEYWRANGIGYIKAFTSARATLRSRAGGILPDRVGRSMCVCLRCWASPFKHATTA